MLSTPFRRRAAKTLAVAGAISGGVYAYDITNARIVTRSARVFAVGAESVLDYRANLRGIPRESPEYRPALQALNTRVAQRLLQLCLANGGLYTKLGQQLSTFNHGLPREITEPLAALQDRARPVPFALAAQTIERELGAPWHALFASVDEAPVAAASLAQVHRARTLDGRDVAVKVQYPHLAAQVRADLRVVALAVRATEWAFPAVQLRWLLPEFAAALAMELDFGAEKRNSRRVAALLAGRTDVHVPEVLDALSAERVLTMEFVDAPKISDAAALAARGLAPRSAATALCELFGEMVFVHGFVHCDPHAGNVLVRAHPDPRAPRREQLVLLDHGLYRQLDDAFRRTYCDLWRAMLLRDAALLDDCGRRLGVGPFAKYLPLLFTYRTLASASPLAASMTERERKELVEDLKQLEFNDVTDFLEQLPRDMLFVFRTNNMVRALNKELGGTSRDRFAVMGKYAVEGHATLYGGAGDADSSLAARFMRGARYYADRATMLLHLHVIDLALALAQRVSGDKPLKMRTAG